MMKFTAAAVAKKSDATVVPFWKGKKGAEGACKGGVGAYGVDVAGPLVNGDFRGEGEETAVVYTDGGRVILLGLGERAKCDVEALRAAYAAVVKVCHSKGWVALNIVLPAHDALDSAPIARGIADGLLPLVKGRRPLCWSSRRWCESSTVMASK